MKYDITNTSYESQPKLVLCPSQDKIGDIDSQRLQSLDDIIICLYLNEINISFLFLCIPNPLFNFYVHFLFATLKKYRWNHISMNWETYHSIANGFFMEILKTILADWNVVSLLMYTVTNEINSEFCPQPIRVGHILNETISSFG